MNDTTKLAVDIPERAAKGWGKIFDNADVLYAGKNGMGPGGTTKMAFVAKFETWHVQFTTLCRYSGGVSGGRPSVVYKFCTHEEALDFAEKKMPMENRNGGDLPQV